MVRFAIDPSVSLSLLLAFSVPIANGFSTGAGSCPPNSPAVGGPHLSSSANQVAFEQASYSFQVNGNAVTGGGSVQLVRGESYSLAVVSAGNPFRGALIRVEGSGVVDADENSITASVCEKGVTHSNPSLKSRLSGTYLVPNDAAESEVAFDVTVVESNNANDGSVYSFRRFTIPVVDPQALAAPPPPSPTAAPVTGNPVQAPTTPQPVNAPTLRPVTASPVRTPTTSSPVMAPIAAPVPAPIAPVPAPVTATAGPTTRPIPSPTSSPIASPVSPPVSSPVAQIVAPPVAAPVPAPIPASSPTIAGPFPTIPIAWLPTPVVPTTMVPIPTIPIPWLPTTSAPVRMPSIMDLPTIPIAWLPTTAQSSEATGSTTNLTDMGDNSTESVLNMTDAGDFNDTIDMMGDNMTDFGRGSSPESLESASIASFSWISYVLSATLVGSAAALFM